MSFIVSIGIAFLIVGAGSSDTPSVSAIKLGFIDEDHSIVAADFARYLEEDLGVELLRSDDVNAMNTALVDKHISGLVEIPKGFETMLIRGEANPILLTFMDDYANEHYTRGYIDAYMESLGVLIAASEGSESGLEELLSLAEARRIPVEAIEKDSSLMQQESDKGRYRATIGFLLMLSLMMSISIARMIFSDRMEGTYRRIKAGCVTSREYVSSVSAVGVLMMFLINIPALVLITLFAGDSGVSAGATAGLLGLYSLFVIAFALFVGLVAQSFGGIIAIIIAVTTISSMLGGAWFPIETAPKVFALLGYVTPQHWFFAAVESFQTGVGSPVGPMLIILLGAALLFVLSGVQFVNNKSLARL